MHRVKWGSEFKALRQKAYAAIDHALVYDYVVARAMGFCEWCGVPQVTCVQRVSHGVTPDSYLALCRTHEVVNSQLAKKAQWIEDNLAEEKLLYVTAAIVLEGCRVLVCEKPNGQWEFPGGKMDEGEYLDECLMREIKEELNLNICSHQPFLLVDHDYGAIKLRLFSYIVSVSNLGEITLSHHKRYDFRDATQLSAVPFSQADIAIGDRLRQLKEV